MSEKPSDSAQKKTLNLSLMYNGCHGNVIILQKEHAYFVAYMFPYLNQNSIRVQFTNHVGGRQCYFACVLINHADFTELKSPKKCFSYLYLEEIEWSGLESIRLRN